MSPAPARFAAVVSDLDGTLLLPGAVLGPATVEALAGLHRAGIPFIVATGRSTYGLRALGPSRERVRLGVCSSGAIGIDPVSEELLWRRELPPETISFIVEVLLRAAPEVGLGTFDGEVWTVTPSYFSARGVWPTGPRRVASPEALAVAGGCALVVSDALLRSADLAALLLAAGVGPAEATVTWAGPATLDVVAPGVDKGYGVRRACGHLGLDPAAAVAFGDGPNDLALFAAVGRGVAMANGHPDVLRAADQVTRTNLEEGVARALVELGMVDLSEV